MFTIKEMKRLLFALCLIITAGCTKAQTFIPPYRILKADSTYSTSADLNKSKPVMIIYFAPDCGHCQHLMQEMKPKMDEFKKMQIVMITFTRTEYPYMRLMRDFIKDYDLKKYHNLTMGTEYPTNKVQQFYQIRTTPFIAVYDHNGTLIKSFEKVPKLDELIATVKKA
jgi:thiol-disulfide isomerase/thioredoxin